MFSHYQLILPIEPEPFNKNYKGIHSPHNDSRLVPQLGYRTRTRNSIGIPTSQCSPINPELLESISSHNSFTLLSVTPGIRRHKITYFQTRYRLLEPPQSRYSTYQQRIYSVSVLQMVLQVRVILESGGRHRRRVRPPLSCGCRGRLISGQGRVSRPAAAASAAAASAAVVVSHAAAGARVDRVRRDRVVGLRLRNHILEIIVRHLVRQELLSGGRGRRTAGGRLLLLLHGRRQLLLLVLRQQLLVLRLLVASRRPPYRRGCGRGRRRRHRVIIFARAPSTALVLGHVVGVRPSRTLNRLRASARRRRPIYPPAAARLPTPQLALGSILKPPRANTTTHTDNPRTSTRARRRQQNRRAPAHFCFGPPDFSCNRIFSILTTNKKLYFLSSTRVFKGAQHGNAFRRARRIRFSLLFPRVQKYAPSGDYTRHTRAHTHIDKTRRRKRTKTPEKKFSRQIKNYTITLTIILDCVRTAIYMYIKRTTCCALQQHEYSSAEKT